MSRTTSSYRLPSRERSAQSPVQPDVPFKAACEAVRAADIGFSGPRGRRDEMSVKKATCVRMSAAPVAG